MLSRSRLNMPPRLGLESKTAPLAPPPGSTAPSRSPTMNRSLQSRATGRAKISGDLGDLRRVRLGRRQPPGYYLRDPVAAHRHPIQPVGRLHRALLMRDHDEL